MNALKKVTQNREETEQRYYQIFEGVADGIVFSDKMGNIIDVNSAFCEITGKGRDEVVGKNAFSLVQKFVKLKDIPAVTDLLKQTYAGKEVVSFNLDFEGKSLDIKTKITGPWGVTAIVRDITDHRNAEKILEESELRFRKMFEDAPVGVFRTTQEGEIVFANTALAKMLGYESVEDIKNMNVENKGYINNGDRKKFIEEIFEKKKVHAYELKWRKRNGDVIFVNEHAHLITDQDGKVFFEGIVEDITDRKKGERELIESKRRLQEAVETKDKFFSIIAHDLRSPISGLLSLSKMLSEDFQSISIGELRSIAGSFYSSTNTVSKLLENLLDWSRLSRNSIEFKPRVCRLCDIVKECISLIKNHAEEKEVEIKIVCGEDIYIFADANMMKSTIRNILSNAVKFSGRGSAVTVSAENRKDKTMIYIEDKGTGMSEETLQNIFKAGVKVSKNGTSGEKGTGLGLLLCKEFMEVHKGRVEVESEKGRGTKVTLCLPNEV